MKEHKAYLGKLDGVSVVWCDNPPKDLKTHFTQPMKVWYSRKTVNYLTLSLFVMNL